MLRTTVRREASKVSAFNNVTLYGLSHALVDFTCAMIILNKTMSVSLSQDYFVFLIVLYNVIAFAFQVPLGYIVDKTKKPVQASLLSYLLLILGVVMRGYPAVSTCFLGLGNALFHLGGGVVVLNLKPHKALYPGLYVAPGAMGLFLGTWLARRGVLLASEIVILLIVAAIITAVIKPPDLYNMPQAVYNRYELIILLFFMSVAARGYTGMALNYTWKSNVNLLAALTAAVVLGKACGGILGDRFGWVKISIPGLLLSAILIFYGFNISYLGIAGMFLFNLTMPITLTAVANMLPNREGFAFGLTTLALIFGALPVFLFGKEVYLDKWSVLLVVLILTFTLYIGLHLYLSSRKGESSYKLLEGVENVNE